MAGRSPGTRDRHQRRSDPRRPHIDLRHRRAHLRVERVGAQDHPRAHGGGTRVRRRSRRGRIQRRRLLSGRRRERRGARGLRALPELPGGPAPPLRADHGRGGEPSRGLRRVHRSAHGQRLAPQSLDQPGDRLHLRPVRQRRAHRAHFPGAGRGCADHGRRSHRHDGGGRGAPRRSPLRGHHRRESQAAGTGQEVRRNARCGLPHHAPGRRPGRARHAGRLRRGPGDVRQRVRLPRDDRQHVPRGQDRGARYSSPADVRGLEHDHLQHADHPRHLRQEDVRDLVQDDGDAPVGARSEPRDHASFPLYGVREGIRGRALRRSREGDPRVAPGWSLTRPPLHGSLQG